MSVEVTPTGNGEVGRVINVSTGYVWVELEPGPACHECGAKIICRPNSSGKRQLRVANTLNATIGDRVLIDFYGERQFGLSLLQYGLPLVCFLVGVLLSSLWITAPVAGIPADLIHFGMGLAMLAVAGGIIFIISRRLSRRAFSVYYLKSVLPDEVQNQQKTDYIR